MTVLVIAEIENKTIAPTTLNTITAASQLGEVHLLLIGNNLTETTEEAKKIFSLSKILIAEAKHYQNQLGEEISNLVVSIAQDYQFFVAAASTFGKNILPRVAALLDVSQISDVIKIVDHKTFIHPIYAGNVLETVQSEESKLVLSIRTTAFESISKEGNSASIENINVQPALSLSEFIEKEVNQSERPELTQAKIIVSGGRGLGSAEKFDSVLTPLAEKLGAAIGASRAAVDSGYAANDLQVGQTGKVVAPELYIAVGISGAIQHLAGMQDSKVIVAINKDPDAPIFNVADYGIVADLFTAVPEFINEIK